MKCAKAIIVFFIFVLFGNCAYSFEGSIKVSAADASPARRTIKNANIAKNFNAERTEIPPANF